MQAKIGVCELCVRALDFCIECAPKGEYCTKCESNLYALTERYPEDDPTERLGKGICKLCNAYIDFCLECDSRRVCTKCVTPNYFLLSNPDGTVICTTCDHEQGGIVYKKIPPVMDGSTYIASGICHYCDDPDAIDQCLICGGQTDHCDKCLIDHYLYPSECVDGNEACPDFAGCTVDNYRYVTPVSDGSGYCYPCSRSIPHCVKCSTDGLSCLQCEPGLWRLRGPTPHTANSDYDFPVETYGPNYKGNDKTDNYYRCQLCENISDKWMVEVGAAKRTDGTG